MQRCGFAACISSAPSNRAVWANQHGAIRIRAEYRGPSGSDLGRGGLQPPEARGVLLVERGLVRRGPLAPVGRRGGRVLADGSPVLHCRCREVRVLGLKKTVGSEVIDLVLVERNEHLMEVVEAIRPPDDLRQ